MLPIKKPLDFSRGLLVAGARLTLSLRSFVEAYVLLDLVAKKIKSLYPDMPLFSIHDSLVTTQPNIELLEQEMEILIHEATTIKPTLDREDWRDSLRIL